MVANIRQMRRLFEAADRDGDRNKFFEDIRQGLESKALKPEDFSIRQLFENFVDGGREIVDSWNPQHGGGGVNLVENATVVDTSAFSNITGQIAFTKMKDAYDAEDFVFSKIIPTTPTQLNGEKIPGIGELGDQAELVNEGKPYPTAGVVEDWIETPATAKRGLIVPVTKEAVFFDRTGFILNRCGDVGTTLGLGKEKRAIDCVIDENSTAHRYRWRSATYATYQSATPWVNIKADNALVDWTDIDGLEQLFDNLVDPNTGEPILVSPKHLVVTRANLNTARRIITATRLSTTTPGYATSGNPTETEWQNPYGGMYTVLWSRLLAARLATDTDWFMGDITKAFTYMENWGLTVVQAPNNSEAEFTQDIVFRYKASERGAYATVEPRAMGKARVAA